MATMKHTFLDLMALMSAPWNDRATDYKQSFHLVFEDLSYIQILLYDL